MAGNIGFFTFLLRHAIFHVQLIIKDMPITSSAKKALRASDKKRVFNLRRKAEMERKVKSFRKCIAEKDKAGA
ncbi:MAG: hypothetical protein NTZ38_00440, partial [Candidatus Taylorbacteria bacterium]|nr:hypothetical protein [Candidatus Taylorbacteria bacterium]